MKRSRYRKTRRGSMRFQKDPVVLPLDPKPLVLVVDDDPVACSSVSRMARTLGYAAQCCSSGASALAFLRDAPTLVKVVLADMGMPRMDGGELAERLQDCNPRLPVVLMAARDDPYVGDLLAGYADFPFLPKPVRLGPLAQVLAACLKSGVPRPARSSRPSGAAEGRRRLSGQHSV
jgi:CheY-like chemotaxis protein